jgi:DNA polymerase V
MTSYQGDETTGFQSPAQDYIEPVVDLAALLDLRRPHLYPVRVVGQSLTTWGIPHGNYRRAPCRRSTNSWRPTN